jgi:hypothetical protein
MMMRALPLPFLAAVFLWLSMFGSAAAAQYQQIPGVIDIRTTFSDGDLSVASVVALAKQKGLQVLVINDHDRLRLEYGLPPFRNILKRSVERNSINQSGAENYLRTIRDAERQHPGMIVIPGSESAPFYYWSGSPFNNTLTAHNHEKRILTIGMGKPDAYRNLPLLHNDSTGRLNILKDGFIFYFAAIVLGILMLRWRGIYRWCGIAGILLSVLVILNSRPFKTSPFDAYHGDQGIAPYQLLIDYVNAAGGLTFWNYPETRSGIRKMGPISVKTLPYPEVLLESRNYTGFAALYGENVTIIEPGGLWDMALIEYCQGRRQRPPWGIATGDFHRESRETSLGSYYNVFLVQSRTKESVLAALDSGRVYAAQGSFPKVIRIEEFTVTDSQSSRSAVSGDRIGVNGSARIRLLLSGADLKNKQAVVHVIKNGSVVHRYQGDIPARIEFEDGEIKPGELVYYRVDIKGEGRIVTNPIFVQAVP